VGGCKLTDSHKAKAAQAARHSRSARAAGFACDVCDYAPLPADARAREVVELASANRPDGGVGVFGDGPQEGSAVYDCAYAELKGYRCSLTSTAGAYARLTDDLKGLGKKSCAVSNARAVGVGGAPSGQAVCVVRRQPRWLASLLGVGQRRGSDQYAGAR
jgi:hypothetical protein